MTKNLYELMETDYFNDIKNSKIIYYCNLQPTEINAEFDLSNSLEKTLSSKEKEFITKIWKEEIKKDNKIFNGKLMQFHSIINEKFFKFRLTDYKHFRGSKTKEFFEICKTTDNIANPLTVTGIIETNDNRIIIGTRGNKKDMWQVAGGMFDPEEDITNNKMDFLNCIKREVKEELCELNLYDFKFIGIVCNRSAVFSTLVFCCKSKEDSKYIKNNHTEKDVKDFWEMPEIDFIDINQDNISNLVVGDINRKLIGTNLASFLLYGRVKFGNDWFNKYSNLISGGVYNG